MNDHLGPVEPRVANGSRLTRGKVGLDATALAYVALPTTFFLWGWLRSPLGIVSAVLVLACTLALSPRADRVDVVDPIGKLCWLVTAFAVVWCVIGGQGHWLYANQDWVVRDAVLVDLVRDHWPVTYVIDAVDTTLRAPIGYYLPAAVIGKLFGLRASEFALAGWTMIGVALTFALMLRDRPSSRVATIRLVIFVVFSGMDIIPTVIRHNPHALGDHIEWWAWLFQFSSQTTQLFWVPNHTIPGWIAIAWVLGQEPKRLPIGPAILFVAFTPLWSPLTALGSAAILGCAIVRRMLHTRLADSCRALLDVRLLVPVLACVCLVYPYLTAGSDKVPVGLNSETRWVGEDFVPRYFEFVVYEFAGFSLLLLWRNFRDPLVWSATLVLLALPFVRFGPFNDLAMRASIPALTLLAIRLGGWLSGRSSGIRDRDARGIALILLAIGAATPFMEVARVCLLPRWDIDATSSVIDVTRGTHYLTPSDHPWLSTFLKQPQVPDGRHSALGGR